jgi:hypothetical protein
MHSSLVHWITSSMADSCGRLSHGTTLNRTFWTEDLHSQDEALSRATRLTDLLDGQDRLDAWDDYLARAEEFRNSARARTGELFRECADLLAVPANWPVFLKKVSCRYHRRQRTTCGLDPDRLDDHADHFASTFGAEPQGSPAAFDDYILTQTLPGPQPTLAQPLTL